MATSLPLSNQLHLTLIKQGNFKKIVISPTCVTCLMDYAFTFTFVSREFPPTCTCCIVCDSINRPDDVDLRPEERVTRVMGFHHANFGLPRPFVLELGRGMWQTDRETDGRWTDRHCPSFHNAPEMSGHNKVNWIFVISYNELSQWLCHDNSTINIVRILLLLLFLNPIIIIIIIFFLRPFF